MMKILMIIKEPLNKVIYNKRRFNNKNNRRNNKRTTMKIKNLYMIDLNHMRNKILMKKMKIRIIWIHKINSMMMNLNNDIYFHFYYWSSNSFLSYWVNSSFKSSSSQSSLHYFISIFLCSSVFNRSFFDLRFIKYITIRFEFFKLIIIFFK